MRSPLNDWIKKGLTKNSQNTANLQEQKNCLALLNEVLDQEADAEQRAYFHQHIKQCKTCYEIYHLEIAIKQLLKEKCCDKKVPSGLVDQIKLKISETI